MRVRVWGAGIVALASLGIGLAIVLSLAGNAATATPRWPWLLDELRQHPWWSVGVFALLAIVAGGIAARLQIRPPEALNDPLPPAPVTVPDWFVDRAQTRTAATAVCRRRRAVGITTSLSGAGGFGKTTLAAAVCARWRVRWRFRSRMFPALRPRIFSVTIGRDVRGRAAVAAKVAEVTRFITGNTTEFDDPALAGAHLGRLLDKRSRTLLVLDDVWEAEQLDPFLTGGRRCVRLVTTRNPALLPPAAKRIPVDQMSRDQAKAVLTWNLPPLPEPLVDALLKSTGRWALLLRLTNRLISEQRAAGADPTATAQRILHQLRGNGPAAVDDAATVWNLDDPRLRNQAVKASIEAATTLLPPGGQDRFTELGIFAEDESIPITAVALLWQASGQLAEDQTRTLCRNLERLSLLTLDPRNGGTISLHDVIRDYLRGHLGSTALAVLITSVVNAGQVFVSYRNARLTVHGRRILVARVLAGRPVAHVAAEMGISRPTAHKWVRRWKSEGDAGLVDRSSRPCRTPHRTPAAVEERVCDLRRTRKLGPARIGPILGLPASTVHRVLTRHRLNRLAWLDRPTGIVIRRYERERPGELIHVDVKKLGRIPDGGGHRTLGRQAGRATRNNVGFDYIHSAVDDHSRLAYSEIHPDEKVATCAGFLTRAAAFFHDQGIPRIERVLTDNAWAYRKGLAWKAALADIGATGKLTRAYRPQTNGKVERFNRTLAEEWAYQRPYTSNDERTAALADFLHTYNHHRSHTALHGHPPITRVNNPAGQYT